MIENVLIKTHLIVHEEYSIKWCGRIIDTNPILQIGSESRMELNTIDMKQIVQSV